VAQPRVVAVSAQRLEGWCRRFEEHHGQVTAATRDGALVLEAADGSWARLRPPVARREAAAPGPVAGVAGLVAELTLPRRVGVLAVRRGGFACAVAELTGGGDGRLLTSKLGRRHVQGRTAAGGWSQQRFARRRDKQVHELLEAVVGHVARVVVPHLPLDAIVTAGDVPLLDDVLSDPRLRSLAGVPRGLHLPSGDPDGAWVAALPDLLRSAQITVLDVTR